MGQSDEEFLADLYSAWKDDEYVRDTQRSAARITEDDVAEGIAVREGRDADEERIRDLLAENHSLERSFQGRFISGLREVALGVLDRDSTAAQIPVGLLPTRALNACAVATPTGGAVILLDHGVIAQLGMLARCTLSFMTWYTEDPICQDSSQTGYARALLALAEHVVSGDVRVLLPHVATLRFSSITRPHKAIDDVVAMVELFILLHEYGHILRGHLSPANVTPTRLHFGRHVDVYTNSEEQEFEADAFAVDALLRMGGRINLEPSHLAIYPGILLKFFELIESVYPATPAEFPRTHPPARDRWARVKDQTGLRTSPTSFAASLDAGFAFIAGLGGE